MRRALMLSLAAGFSAQALLVVSGILVARTLGVTDRGHLALLTVLAAALGFIGALGVPDALSYYVSRGRPAARTLARRIVPVALGQVSAIIVVQACVLAVLFRDEPASLQRAAGITLAWTPAFVAYQYALAVLQAERRFLPFNILRVLPTALYTPYVVAVVLVGRTSVASFALGWVLSYAVSSATAVLCAARATRGAVARSDVTARQMLGFGARGVVGQLSFAESFRVDQLVAGLFLGATSLGLYAVAAAFTTLSAVIAMSIGLVEYAHVAPQRDLVAGRRLILRYLTLTVFLCSGIVGVLILVMPTLLPWLFGEDFADAVPVARILLLAGIPLAARRILSDGLRGLGRPTAGTFAELASWLVLVPLLAILTPVFGITGVASAVAVSACAGTALLGVLLARVTSVRPNAEAIPAAVAPAGEPRSRPVYGRVGD
jgi:O-antigen/teichoic acid export membrane protein